AGERRRPAAVAIRRDLELARVAQIGDLEHAGLLVEPDVPVTRVALGFDGLELGHETPLRELAQQRVCRLFDRDLEHEPTLRQYAVQSWPNQRCTRLDPNAALSAV